MPAAQLPTLPLHLPEYYDSASFPNFFVNSSLWCNVSGDDRDAEFVLLCYFNIWRRKKTNIVFDPKALRPMMSAYLPYCVTDHTSYFFLSLIITVMDILVLCKHTWLIIFQVCLAGTDHPQEIMEHISTCPGTGVHSFLQWLTRDLSHSVHSAGWFHLFWQQFSFQHSNVFNILMNYV